MTPTFSSVLMTCSFTNISTAEDEQGIICFLQKNRRVARKASICSQSITTHIFVGHRLVYLKCVRKSSFCIDYIQQLFCQNPNRTVRLIGPTTRVRPDESQEVLVVVNYIRILPLTPGPYATKEFFCLFWNLNPETRKRETGCTIPASVTSITAY